MSWLAISDGRHARRLPPARHPELLVATGSLVVEALFNATERQPQTLVVMDRLDGWRRTFEITVTARGEILLEYWQGPTVTRGLLRMGAVEPDATLRLTYAWDAPGRDGMLTGENLDSGVVVQAAVDDPQPLPLDDIAALAEAAVEECALDPTVSLLAVSDRIEPIGLPLGYLEGTMVLTATGYRAIEDIVPGDLVETAGSGLRPVRQMLRRKVPAFGQYAPVTLRRPFFGLRRDLSVAQSHRILISGADTEYLFGEDSVLAEARHLARMAAAPRDRALLTVEYHHLLLDEHDCISVDGAWSETLFLDNIAEHPSLLKTSALASVPPADLPVHRETALLPLKTYEAMVLVSALCA